MFNYLSNLFSSQSGGKRTKTRRGKKTQRKQRGGSCGCGEPKLMQAGGAGCGVRKPTDNQAGGKSSKRTKRTKRVNRK
jgi:hypothetical protein